jgi:hypothetical protein
MYVTLDHKDQSYIMLHKSDFIKVSITSFANGFASGKFTAKLTPLSIRDNPDMINSGRGSVVVTQGHFKNIKYIN